VTELGIIILVIPVPLSAAPKLVIQSGIVKDVSPLQLANAPILIVITEVGIVTDVIPVQLKNAYAPILVTVIVSLTYVLICTTKLDRIVTAPVADGLDVTLAVRSFVLYAYLTLFNVYVDIL
jgi:hypothetical protein